MINLLLVLKFYLLVSLILAPVMTRRFFLDMSKPYLYCHIVSLSLILLGQLFTIPLTVIVWPIFCIYGLFLFIKDNKTKLKNPTVVLKFFPFLFSLVASTWFVAGTLNLRLLGYDTLWSYLAALHGNFLGWLLIGCFVFIAEQYPKASSFYKIGSVLCSVCFFFIALGIDGVAYVKPIGILGVSILVPILIGKFYFLVDNDSRKYSKKAAAISFIGILLTLGIAVLNEYDIFSLKRLFSFQDIILFHGGINAFIVVPAFYFAVLFDTQDKGS